MTDPVLIPGRKYRIIHQSPSQRYPRVSVMRLIGDSELDDAWLFDARPLAGTQTLPKEWMIECSETTPDAAISINERA